MNLMKQRKEPMMPPARVPAPNDIEKMPMPRRMSVAAQAAAQHVSDMEGHMAFLESQIEQMRSQNHTLSMERDIQRDELVAIRTKLQTVGALLLDILDHNVKHIDTSRRRADAEAAGLVAIDKAMTEIEEPKDKPPNE